MPENEPSEALKSKAKMVTAFPKFNPVDERQEVAALLKNIKDALPDLQKLLQKCVDHWGYEDGIYRFYHQSFKVYDLQEMTLEIVNILKQLAPITDREKFSFHGTGLYGTEVHQPRPYALHPWFLEVISSGTGKIFKQSDNGKWLEITRPIVEAFLHAKYFLEMVIQYGKELESAPNMMPSGWAAVLYLYDLR